MSLSATKIEIFERDNFFINIYNLYLCSTKKIRSKDSLPFRNITIISLANSVCIFWCRVTLRLVHSFVPTLYIASGSWTLIEIRPVPMLAREKNKRNNDAVQRRSNDFVESRVERANMMLLPLLQPLRIRSPAPIAISRLRVLINPNCTTRTRGRGKRDKRGGGV